MRDQATLPTSPVCEGCEGAERWCGDCASLRIIRCGRCADNKVVAATRKAVLEEVKTALYAESPYFDKWLTTEIERAG